MSKTIDGLEVLDLKPGDPLPGETKKVSVLVTPQLAADWIHRFADPKKRHVRPSKVEDYAADMIAGKWLAHKDSLEFTCDPGGVQMVSDGHHRIHAVVKAEMPIRFEVWFNAPFEARRVEGNRLVRSAADGLMMEGCEAYATAIAAATKDVLLYRQTTGTDVKWRKPNIIQPDKDDLILCWLEDPDLWHDVAIATDRAMGGLVPGISPKAVRAFAYLAEEAHRGVGLKFLDDIARGGGPTSNGRPTATVMTALVRANGPSGSGTQLEWDRRIMEILIRAFNAHLRGAVTYTRPHLAGSLPFVLSTIRP
jgi:hypothetical protein